MWLVQVLPFQSVEEHTSNSQFQTLECNKGQTVCGTGMRCHANGDAMESKLDWTLDNPNAACSALRLFCPGEFSSFLRVNSVGKLLKVSKILMKRPWTHDHTSIICYPSHVQTWVNLCSNFKTLRSSFILGHNENIWLWYFIPQTVPPLADNPTFITILLVLIKPSVDSLAMSNCAS